MGDDAVLHLWESGDESWRDRSPLRAPSARAMSPSLRNRELSDPRRRWDELYDEMRRSDVPHGTVAS